jgi:hypothetical protein
VEFICQLILSQGTIDYRLEMGCECVPRGHFDATAGAAFVTIRIEPPRCSLRTELPEPTHHAAIARCGFACQPASKTLPAFPWLRSCTMACWARA